MKIFRLLCKSIFCRYGAFTQTRQYAYRCEGMLRTMKLDSPEFRALFTPELNRLSALFVKHGFELRIAGGAVRDLMMQKVPHDVDFATTATPDQMKRMFEEEGVRLINNRGEKHGTITARINDKENFEVTTLRIDVRTDGRHADVEFTKDWQLDANRRDLTINAMFLDLDGTVYDYFHGKEDLDACRLCFVGSTEERIQEDYLRILRYFRFYGRIALGPDCHEKETLEAIEKHKDGLAGVSGERKWMEMRKIVVGRFNGPIMKTMLKLGIGPHIGIGEQADVEEFVKVCQATSQFSPQPITLLTALFSSSKQIEEAHKCLKLSNEEVRIAQFLLDHRQDPIGSPALRYLMDLHNDTAGHSTKVKERVTELLIYRADAALLQEYLAWTPTRFPITGFDLIQRNVPKGPTFKRTLDDLRQLWKESGYQMSKEELEGRIDDVISKYS